MSRAFCTVNPVLQISRTDRPVLLEPLALSVHVFDAGWQFTRFCSRLAVLFEPDGSELEQGGNEFFAGLGISLPPPSPNSHYFLVLLFSLGFDRSHLLRTDV